MFAGLDTCKDTLAVAVIDHPGARGDSAPVAQPRQRIPSSVRCAEQSPGDASGKDPATSVGRPPST